MPSSRNLRTAKSITPLENGTQTYRGRLNSLAPDPLYRVRFHSRSSLDLKLSGLQANVDLTLLDGQGRVLQRSARIGPASESLNHTVAPGTYYIRVSRQQGETRYRLRLTTTPLPQKPLPAVPPPEMPLIEQVLTLTNQHRLAIGLQPLRLNPILNAAAYAHSRDMAEQDYFSHYGLDGSTVYGRITALGYPSFITTENIAAGFSSPETVVQAWMDSPGHRANILNPLLEEIGIGFFFLEHDEGKYQSRYYWTQNFGTPAR